MKKNITPEVCRDAIVNAWGKYGYFPLNDYYEMRNIILFGDKHHEYVYGLDEMLPAKVIDAGIKMLEGDTIITVRREFIGHEVWELSILPMADRFVCGRPWTIMRKDYKTLEDCLRVIEEHKDEILAESMHFYVTGDSEGVAQAEEIFG